MEKNILKKQWIIFAVVILFWALHFLPEIGMFSLLACAMHATVVTLGQLFVFIIVININKYSWISKKSIIAVCSIVFVTIVSEYLYFEKYYALESREFEYEDIIFNAIFASVIITLTLILAWIYVLIEKDKKRELEVAELKNLNKTTELSMLKQQINPHFLFNALSNIYSIAYLGDKQTPDKIMQLADMLRYVLYGCEKDEVTLEQEIIHIENYIDFQKFKIKKGQNITFNHDECNKNIMIAPMLLIPFVENAIKHSNINIEEQAELDITLMNNGSKIYFTVENTISSKEQFEHGGIGIENTRNRLDLLYKESYELKFTNDKKFKVQLTINKDG